MKNPKDDFNEALESCRPGDLDRLDELPELRDLAAAVEVDPELAARLAAAHEADAKLADALRNSPCPTGLADRISSRIAEVEASKVSRAPRIAEKPSPAVSSPVESSPQKPSPQKPSHEKRSRRAQWIAISSVAALLLAAVLPVVWPSPALDKSQLVARTPVWKKATANADWRSSDPPMDRAPSLQLGYLPEQVAVFSTADDSRTTAYRYFRPLQRVRGQIYLFVVKTDSIGLPTSPPMTPDFDSGGIRVGVWSEKGLVYALVVLGNDDAYHQMVRSRARAA